uniref:Odorant binding protein 3 n=1 Tax=Macrocentrus cingulum TaxID=535359 RepID=A0A221I2K4_9HYME|nr:odorant binding protein 3 [Macrocentrus cingulum]
MTRVLFVISALSLLVLVHAGPIPKEFQDVAAGIRETCMKESGVVLELIERAGKGDFADDQTLKCYLKCIFDQFRLISKKGFNYKAFLTLAPPDLKDKATKLIELCGDTTGKPDDMCDLSWNINKCMYNAYPDVYFIF